MDIVKDIVKEPSADRVRRRAEYACEEAAHEERGIVGRHGAEDLKEG